MVLSIRTATLEDVSLLNELACTTYRSHYGKIWISKREMEGYFDKEYSYEAIIKSLNDPGESWYLISEDKPIGFAKVIWESGIPGIDKSGVLLSKLYLNDAATGKGYGKQIVEVIMQYSKDRGYQYFWLEVLEQNERACRFYENQGLVYISNSTFIAGSREITLKVMGKAL